MNSETTTYDYLIFGQGLAGSILAWQLTQKGRKVLLIDDGHKSSSTRVAAGIINPITGKRLAKAWNIDAALPLAKQFYTSLGAHFGNNFFQQQDILRIFRTPTEHNVFQEKRHESAYKPYIGEYFKPGDIEPNIEATYGAFTIKQGGYLRTGELLDALQRFFKQKNALLTTRFEYDAINIGPNFFKFQGNRARNCIFAEGYRGHNNPLFPDIPWALAKGETLKIKITDPIPKGIINNRRWLCPTSTPNIYTAGATYAWDQLNNTPSAEGKEEILSEIKNFYKKKVEVTEQLAGVRPCTEDAKPIILENKKYPGMYFFNGFASKGCLQVPYFAQKFIQEHDHE